MRLCPSCITEKDYTCFSKSTSCRDGYRVYCKSCDSKAYFKNKKVIDTRNKLYREKNREKVLLIKKKYRINNKEKILNYGKNYKKDRKKIDINFKLKEILRKRLWDALKGKNKSDNTMSLLGCDIER